jgi:hypothetical protein
MNYGNKKAYQSIMDPGTSKGHRIRGCRLRKAQIDRDEGDLFKELRGRYG